MRTPRRTVAGMRTFWVPVIAILLPQPQPGNAAFVEAFDRTEPIVEVGALEAGGWSFYTGDGEATVNLVQRDGFASMEVDARADRRNIWWAVIRARIDGHLDLEKLSLPGSELRIEARVRTSHAPRRVNLHLSTATSGSHENLREFDIAEAGVWQTISMTTENFPAGIGDMVFCQMAMMDWGRDLFSTDVGGIKVEIVERALAEPDVGNPLAYHPQAPNPETLPHRITVTADAIIDEKNPDLPLNEWGVDSGDVRSLVLPVTPSQTTILRWNFDAFAASRIEDPGVLEITTHAVTRLLGDFEELGRIRVMEILPTAPPWDEASVDYMTFTGNHSLDTVINAQPVVDVEIDPIPGATNRIVISQPVLQRLLSGRTPGLALRALGPVNATFPARETGGTSAPHLCFRTADD